MHRLHIVGGRNHGKTTLVEELVSELSCRGLRVGTIKHTHHQHELDVPGKDSHRHREAGAAVVGILTPLLSAAFWTNCPSAGPDECTGDARYERFAAVFASCDLVLVEGDTRTSGPKLEVWRAERGTPLLAGRLSHVLAIVSDDAAPGPIRVLPRSQVSTIASFIMEHFQLAPQDLP